MREPARSETLQAAVRGVGATVNTVELDVTQDESVSNTVSAVVAEAGCVDVLVNNAGVGHAGTVEEMDLQLARTVFETNFWGPVRLIRAVVPHMRRRGGGVIVNVSSFSTRLPALPVVSMYAATKAALSTLTEALRWEVAEQNIRVFAIEPGFFTTELYHGGQTHVGSASPYAPLVERVDRILADSLATGDDPARLGEIIVNAVADITTPARLVVGQDAEQRIDAFQTMGIAKWDTLIERLLQS
jgi:NAD(P)-dependent dehydrogenase (short-subunit alcohol dehydrogenase family)